MLNKGKTGAVFGMTRFLLGDWTRDLRHSKKALYHSTGGVKSVVAVEDVSAFVHLFMIMFDYATKFIIS